MSRRLFGVCLGVIFGIVLFVGGGFLGGVLDGLIPDVSAPFFEQVFAADSVETQADDLLFHQVKTAATLEKILKVIYLIMRPFLAIAGAALDNTFIYGEIFYLDRSLFRMRQMMRNFANFGMGVVFLSAIFITIAKGGDGGKRDVRKILPKLLLGVILVQSSYYLVAASLDLATIGTYAIGTLPVRVTMENETMNQRLKYVMPKIGFSLDDTKAIDASLSEHTILYECPGNGGGEVQRHFVSCLITGGVFAQQKPQNKNGTWENHKKNQVDGWNSYVEDKRKLDVNDVSDQYCVSEGMLVTADHGNPVNWCKMAKHKLDGYTHMNTLNCPNLQDFVDRSAKATGPMYALYTSILGFSEISLSPAKGVTEMGLEFMMKLIVAILLIIPLLALALALIVRAVFLWGVIIFSPFIVIVSLFGIGSGSLDKVGGGDKLIGNILGLIFMPVVAVFAICMSMIFLSLLEKNHDLLDETTLDLIGDLVRSDSAGSVCDTKTGEFIKPSSDGVDVGGGDSGGGGDAEEKKGNLRENCYFVMNIFEICFSEAEKSFGNGIMNTLSWLIVNFFGIALMWGVVFAALRTSKWTSGITDFVSNTAGEFLKSQPIIPIPGGSGPMSLAGLKQFKDTFKNNIGGRALDQAKNFDSLVDNVTAKNSDDKKKVDEKLTGDDQHVAGEALKGLASNTSAYDYGTNGSNYATGIMNAAGTGKTARSMADVFKDRTAYDYMKSNLDLSNHETFAKHLVKTNGRIQQRDLKRLNEDMYKGLTGGLKGIVPLKHSRANIESGKSNRFYDKESNQLIEMTNKPSNFDVQYTDIKIPTTGGEDTAAKMNQAIDLNSPDMLGENRADTYSELPAWMKNISKVGQLDESPAGQYFNPTAGFNDPDAFTVADGQLPAGRLHVKLDSNGAITSVSGGTPPADTPSTP